MRSNFRSKGWGNLENPVWRPFSPSAVGVGCALHLLLGTHSSFCAMSSFATRPPSAFKRVSDLVACSRAQTCANFASHDNRRANFWLTNEPPSTEMRLYFYLWIPTIALKEFSYKLCCLYPQCWPTSVRLEAATWFIRASLECDAFPALPPANPPPNAFYELFSRWIQKRKCSCWNWQVNKTHCRHRVRSILLINAWLWWWGRI